MLYIVNKIIKSKNKIVIRNLGSEFSIIVITISLVVFCFVKWEAAVNRYFIVYFGLLTISSSYLLQSINMNAKTCNCSNSVRQIRGIFSGMILLICLADFSNGMVARWNMMESKMPFSEHDQNYYWYYRGWDTQYSPLRNALQGVQTGTIGVDSQGLMCQYPIIKLIDQHCINMKYVKVQGVTGKYEDYSNVPDYIVIIGSYNTPLPQINNYEYGGVEYRNVRKLSDYCYLAVKK